MLGSTKSVFMYGNDLNGAHPKSWKGKQVLTKDGLVQLLGLMMTAREKNHE
jgi:hypothetical protein